MSEQVYDVGICGAGLAGLTLARQLKLQMPDLSIVVFDRLPRPLPEAAFKVGESTLSVSTAYFCQILQLKDYLDKSHLPKLGLRYFFGDTQGDFKKRPEFGPSKFHAKTFPYQLDRGRLENDLRQLNAEAGIEVLEDCLVKEIELSENTDQPHEIIFSQGNTKNCSIKARWVVDAMGRRRYLQKKLGLAIPATFQHSAVWFRVEGRADVSDFVPDSEKEWQDRVPDKNRFYSTNHLCAKGYWVWLIPLSSGYTSIGIVTNEAIHPFEEYHTYEKACEWLEKHEPVMAEYIKAKEPTDFMKMPRYSHSSKQVCSINRWACVGEAGVFTDPFHSSGSDLIAVANTLTTRMIQLDREGKLTREITEDSSNFIIAYRDRTAEKIRRYYSCFDNEVATGMKHIWDVMAGFSYNTPLISKLAVIDLEKRDIIMNGYAQFCAVDTPLQQLFLDWSERSERNVTYDFLDVMQLPFFPEHRLRNLTPDPDNQDLINDHVVNLEVFEELAQAIFLIAVADTMPEQLHRFAAVGWLNARAISLDPNRWEADGLFKPASKPRNMGNILEPLRKALQMPEPQFNLFSQYMDVSQALSNSTFFVKPEFALTDNTSTLTPV